MSHEEFVEHYESVHARIGEKVMSGYATRYVRRFPRLSDARTTARRPTW